MQWRGEIFVLVIAFVIDRYGTILLDKLDDYRWIDVCSVFTIVGKMALLFLFK